MVAVVTAAATATAPTNAATSAINLLTPGGLILRLLCGFVVTQLEIKGLVVVAREA